jgi:hypothetical protein
MMLDAAIELAAVGWPIVPLRGKVPIVTHGLLEATTDPAIVASWWRRWPQANIGARVPESLLVVDVDPRAGGWTSLELLEGKNGALPETLTVRTGGSDRGEHRYFLRPPGPLTMAKLGAGVDLRLPGRHYCVMPPSVHPESGRLYEWADPEFIPVLPPAWLVALLRPPAPPPRPSRPPMRGDSERPGDLLAASMSWHELLEPHGWTWIGSKGEVELWRRPGKAGGPLSATTNALGTDHLHVFSSNASPFKPDESYSKFGAFTLLEHGGDFPAAARALRREAARH